MNIVFQVRYNLLLLFRMISLVCVQQCSKADCLQQVVTANMPVNTLPGTAQPRVVQSSPHSPCSGEHGLSVFCLESCGFNHSTEGSSSSSGSSVDVSGKLTRKFPCDVGFTLCLRADLLLSTAFCREACSTKSPPNNAKAGNAQRRISWPAHLFPAPQGSKMARFDTYCCNIYIYIYIYLYYTYISWTQSQTCHRYCQNSEVASG